MDLCGLEDGSLKTDQLSQKGKVLVGDCSRASVEGKVIEWLRKFVSGVERFFPNADRTDRNLSPLGRWDYREII
jgi:hypothetical protein